MESSLIKHTLQFKVPSGTSRGVLTDKPSWFLVHQEGGDISAISECSLIPGLSIDKPSAIESVYHAYIDGQDIPEGYPALRFAQECFEMSKASPNPFILYPSPWTEGKIGIPINGLIWMGDVSSMKSQIRDKIALGYTCIKMKIGAIDFEEEYQVLKGLRSIYNDSDIAIRVDANGAFSVGEALEKLKRLADLDIHSIEQPIKAGQWQEMAKLCDLSPLDIALDEELIGVFRKEDQTNLLKTIRPQYIILKPSLLGGLVASDQWINIAEELGIGWWATSALESNIGLNAIAQWTATKKVSMPQGLGTGGLYTNNVESPMSIKDGFIWYDDEGSWDLQNITI